VIDFHFIENVIYVPSAESRVARFLLFQSTKTGENTKLPQNIPNGHKIFPMAVK
jgi:hypothetical protein